VLAHSARYFEICFDVNKRKAVPVVQNEVGIVDAELQRVPILNQPIEHIKVMREIDDTSRIAVRKSNWHSARKGAWRGNEPTFFHSMSCAGILRRRQTLAFLVLVAVLTICESGHVQVMPNLFLGRMHDETSGADPSLSTRGGGPVLDLYLGYTCV